MDDTLPRMRHWQEVLVDDWKPSVEYNDMNKTMNVKLCIHIKINDEWFTIFLNYNNTGFVITNHISNSNRILESLPLFAKTNFDASFEPSEKIVGEVYIEEEMQNNYSTREYIFGNKVALQQMNSRKVKS